MKGEEVKNKNTLEDYLSDARCRGILEKFLLMHLLKLLFKIYLDSIILKDSIRFNTEQHKRFFIFYFLKIDTTEVDNAAFIKLTYS